jgi:PAS domain S-box-containing protein
MTDPYVERSGAQTGARRSRAAFRFILATFGPALAALALGLVYLSPITRWLIFVLAVIASARFGGLKSGLTATILSAVLIWYFLIPPVQTVDAADKRQIDAAVIFIALGIVISVTYDRLGRARRASDEALRQATRSNEQLSHTIHDLEENRRLFQSVIDYSPGIIVVKDLKGKLLLFNRSFEQSLGLSVDQLRGQTVYDLFPPDVGERRRAADQSVIRTHAPVMLEETIELADGKHDFLASAFPLDDDQEKLFGVCWIETDITEKKRVEEELKESQRLCQSVIDYSPGIIVVKDLKGKLLLFNKSFEQSVGLTHDQLRGRTVYDLFPPTQAERRRATDQTVLRTHAPVTLEETVEQADGKHVFLASAFPLTEDDGSPFGVCWIETDISARKQAENELRRAATDLAEAQRVGRIGSWSWEMATDTVTWSDEMYRLHRQDSHLPAPPLADFSRLYTKESAAALRAALDGARADGTSFELELETVQPESSTRWIADRGEAVRDDAGRIVGVRGISQDISRLKDLEQLREEWISVIAHDLRQPIGAIKMASQLLPDLHTGTMNDEEATVTARVGSAAESLRRMVEDLLDVSRLETNRLSLDRSWVNPQIVVRDSIDRVSHLTKGCRIDVSEHSTPRRVYADAVRLEQVLGNLISNAAKYGERNGEIRVRVTGRGTEVDVAVTNRGPGISPDDVSKLFTRFGRLKGARRSGIPGLGLGLYIAKGIIEAHGGRMWVDSVPNETTTFHFTLPVTSRAEAVG